MGSTMGDLTRILSDTGRNSDIPLVWNAFQVAERAHRGRRRRSGDRYITHPVEVATIVARHGGTVPAVCAALLHDVIEDESVSAGRLRIEFGPEIATMVEELTARAARTQNPVSRELVLVTVADRLHNLRTLHRMPAASRRRTSLDTLVVHVPLANRLDAPVIAGELTDLACAALDSLERPGAREHKQRLTAAVRRADPRLAVQAVAAFGGGAAVIGSGVVPEWALASGGAGALALLAAVLFSRDPRAAQRLAEFLRARRRD